MLYIVDVAHYIVNQGYTHTETVETGHCDDYFTSAAWNASIDDPYTDNDNSWVDITVAFYADGAHPGVDDPLRVDTLTI